MDKHILFLGFRLIFLAYFGVSYPVIWKICFFSFSSFACGLAMDLLKLFLQMASGSTKEALSIFSEYLESHVRNRENYNGMHSFDHNLLFSYDQLDGRI